MNSLLSYGSDDDLDESGDEGYSVEPQSVGGAASSGVSRNYKKSIGAQDDTNYDEVQMSLSEDSDSEPSNKRSKDRAPSRDTDAKRTYKRETRDDRNSRDDDRYNRDDNRHSKEDRYSRDDERYSKDDDDRSKNRDRDEDRIRNRDDDRSKDRYRDDERSRRDRRSKSRERERSSRDDRYSRDRRDRDRRRSRSRSRDRRRSRSPRRSRSRSRSRDRAGGRGSYYRKDRIIRERSERNESKMDNPAQTATDNDSSKDRFFMPGITGRFRDQIEKRKMLWQKGKEAEKPASAPVAAATTSKTTKVWETTTFAQDTDGKVANKFKRLMGIKTPVDSSKVATEVLKKQEEMFSSMEAQYEVARTATHTMRGVGLGFGSYQR